ncbi:hypothetical protein GCM10023329_53390 [Streptomyces sanyensis]|uniref:Integral membrane protein n=1 Tax=Streptomyces sanyensis TaxID=568869 RepID=A0ABP9BE71_9ACTN
MNPVRLLLALSGWAALAATALPSASVPRTALVAAFLLVCPGLAAVRPGRAAAPRHGSDRTALLEQAVLAVVLSLALSALVALGLFLAGVFTAVRALVVLACLTSALALLPRPPLPRRTGGRP